MQVPPQSNNIRQQLFDTLPEDFYMFQREFYFYNSVLDLFKGVIEDEGEDVDILDFASNPLTLPGQLTFNRGFEEPLVLENLSFDGYKMWEDEFNGLDLAHAIVSLETFGKMHALGMVLFDKKVVKDDNLCQLLEFDYFKMFTDQMLGMVDNGMKAVVEWMAENDVEEESITKMECLLNDRNYVKMMTESFEKGKSEEMQVILHGDARSNNILYKYGSDGRTPVGVKLVDFQGSFSFCPFFDLVYFFMLSVSADVLIPNYQTLVSR